MSVMLPLCYLYRDTANIVPTQLHASHSSDKAADRSIWAEREPGDIRGQDGISQLQQRDFIWLFSCWTWVEKMELCGLCSICNNAMEGQLLSAVGSHSSSYRCNVGAPKLQLSESTLVFFGKLSVIWRTSLCWTADFICMFCIMSLHPGSSSSWVVFLLSRACLLLHFREGKANWKTCSRLCLDLKACSTHSEPHPPLLLQLLMSLSVIFMEVAS